MAREKYYRIVCDICGKEVLDAHEVILQEWRHIENGGKMPVDYEYDWCDECYKKVMEMIDSLKEV